MIEQRALAQLGVAPLRMEDEDIPNLDALRHLERLPHDLASFKAALLEGDRRLVRRRRRRAAGGVAGILAAAVLALVVALPNTLDAPAVAAEARKALSHQGLVLHSETEILRPGGKLHQRISRWSLGDRSRSISFDGTHTVESSVNGRTVRVRLDPGGPIDTLTAKADTPDPLLAHQEVLAHATEVDEVTVGGVPAYRLEVPGRIRQTAYLRRSDRLPIRVEIQGGATTLYRVVEWLPEDRSQLDLK